MSQDATNAPIADNRRRHVRLFGKAWEWLTARVGGKQQGQLRLFVHRHPRYRSFWQPIATPDQQLRTEIQIHLEASNLAASACRIMTAEIAGMPATQTVIGVRDVRTGKFAPDNLLPPRQLSTISLHFLVDGQSPSIAERFRATVILTDHVGERHPITVIMH